MTATPAWIAIVEAMLNRGIDSSTEAAALARRLGGTALRIDVQGLASIRASAAGGRLILAAADTDPAAQPAADATLSGTPLALLQLAGRPAGPGRPVNRNPAQVRGDAEIANQYRQLFALARPDAEEELSRVMGDLAARRLSRFAGAALGWARRTRRTAGENVAEYLQEESRDLVNKPELEEFLRGVDVVRETADRIEARVDRLERRFKGAP